MTQGVKRGAIDGTTEGEASVLLSASLYVLLSGRYDADTRGWAGGVVGVVIGYWLR